MADLSLDDIIKKKKPQISGMKGRGGIRKAQPRAPAHPAISPRLPGRVSKPVTDARLKIIQKNREKLTDARDKLAEIAKQSDARLKLEKIRATNNKKNQNQQLTGISRKTGRNGKVTLSTNRLPALMPVNNYNVPSINNYSHQNHHQHHHQQHHHHQQSQSQHQNHQIPRSVTYRRDLDDPRYHDMEMDYMNDDYMMDSVAPIRRTVANDYTPSLPPPPPVFGAMNKSAASYSWPKHQQNLANQSVQSITRSVSMRKIDHDRPRELKVIHRSPIVQKAEPTVAYRENWSFGAGKGRTILGEEHEDKYFEPRTNRREPVVKIGRLEPAVKASSRTGLGGIARGKTVASSGGGGGGGGGGTGYRIVVSNLQTNVTQEDIKELFEDVGELLVSRLVRAGTAEVIYKTLKDAKKAVDTYHNRQLDGHPMKCLLVNPRPKNNPTAPAVRPLLDPRRSSGSSFVQPNIGAVHRALFDDGHK